MRRLDWREAWPVAALTLILLVAAVLRLSGIAWDETTHLHPDERFLTMVETGLQLPQSIGEFFDTQTSRLNPFNANYTFFVYGTFPIFFVRYLAEWTSQIGYDQVHLLGRAASALFDLISLVLLYALGRRLYGRTVGVLAALLGAFTVLLIQHSHFFVVDLFASTFVIAGLYLAVRAQDEGRLRDYALFGVCLGAGMASKINTFPLAGVIVLAVVARVFSLAREKRELGVLPGLFGILLAALATIITFRVLQPYAFQGPAFWNILPNREWLADLQEVRIQASGQADLPFALQWADRPVILFALNNMLLWGMGLPLGLAAWASWAWAGVESLRGRWQRHLVPVVWTGAYFVWQGSSFTPAMRYQLPAYPTLILLAAWGAVGLWRLVLGLPSPRRRWAVAGLGVVSVVLAALHIGYGIGFTRIYTTPFTRVDASRWMYGHIPAAVNVLLDDQGEEILDPLPSSADFVLGEEAAYAAQFKPMPDGSLTSIGFPRVIRLGQADGPAAVHAQVLDAAGTPLGEGNLVLPGPDTEPSSVLFDSPLPLVEGETYVLRLSVRGAPAVMLDGNLELRYDSAGQQVGQTLELNQEETPISADRPHLAMLNPTPGTIRGVRFGPGRLLAAASGPARVTISLLEDPSASPVATASGIWEPASTSDSSWSLEFSEPVNKEDGRAYWMRTEVAGSPIALRGSRLINESSWDDGLPTRIDNRDAFGGLYTGINQELYWADNEDADGDGRSDKLERIVDSLDQGDYLVITSNRQYGSIPRVPIRYPLTAAYYRLLFDCPEPTPVHDCAAVAAPSPAINALGYQLVAIFQSNPRLGPFQVNDQTAEETFTVYDHPKVLIFARTPAFSRESVEALLGAVDLSQIQHLVPAEVGKTATVRDLLLPPERLAEQQANGTWADLFPPDSWVNRSEVLATVAWWLLIAVLGWIAFPIARVAFPGFEIGSYALSRTLGMLLLSWGSWFAGSYRVPFRTTTILGILLLILLASAVLAYRSRQELGAFLRQHRRQILWIELLALGLFLLDLGIRLGNPDLWHPWKGGEKPMDFSYFNAVLRSTSFPPYDPWYAGGYINYYYFGFVLVGVPVRLLGLDPAVAYNLILPTLFSLLGASGYAVAVELARRAGGFFRSISPSVAGLAAAAGLVLLGNLGTARMGYDGLKQIGAEGESTREMLAGIPQALKGLGKFLTLQAPLPYRMDEWYWNPSRAIPSAPGDVDPITEFPFFTFLYADLHAHMISLPLTVLGLGWAVSWVLAAGERKRIRWWARFAAVVFGGLILGSLRPTNTWDFPVYLAFGALAAVSAPFLQEKRWTSRAAFEALAMTIALLLAAWLLYLPYTQWYAQGYTDADFWHGSRTSLRAYLTVHGVFLFFIVAWLASETIGWLAATPISALSRWRRFLGWGVAGLVLFGALLLFGLVEDVRVVLLVLPLTVWAGVLFFRRGQPLAKRIVLLLTAVALTLTVVVEVVVLVGDIGRMNTVFKFYLQVWTLFSIAAAAGFYWCLVDLPLWRRSAVVGWSIAGAALVAGALLFPLTATPAKIRDRMAVGSPHTLDGTAFMPLATYYDQGGQVSLAEDYRAIQWLQDNVSGSPVIVEANIPEYRWGTRATIYTGLPGVLGWNWHQRQQRAAVSGDPVTERALELVDFYSTPSAAVAADFLEKYGARYVLVGGLERMYFDRVQPCWPAADGVTVECDMAGRPLGMQAPAVSPQECTPLSPEDPTRLSCPTHGLEKFETMAARGALREVYRDGDTVIYEFIP
jgi:YYY domain-containing protein